MRDHLDTFKRKSGRFGAGNRDELESKQEQNEETQRTDDEKTNYSRCR